MASLIVPMDLGPSAFSLGYRYETRNEDWRMFHAHQGLELLYIHQGNGLVTVERKQYALQPRTLFIFQPYQLHKVEVPPQEGAPYIRTNLTFDPRAAEPYAAPFPKLLGFLRRLAKGTLSQQVFPFGGDARVEELLASFQHARLRADGEAQDEERALFLIALLRHLQLHVFPPDEPAAAGAEKASRHVERMMDWLETHYRQPFELETMAQELHLSPYHVSHLFKRHTGITLSDYIAGRRVREACALLANTDKPISEIGRNIGGFSAPYFCQLFKKHKGVTPQSYRATVRRAYE